MSNLVELIKSEISDFCATLEQPGEPETAEQIQAALMKRILPLLGAGPLWVGFDPSSCDLDGLKSALAEARIRQVHWCVAQPSPKPPSLSGDPIAYVTRDKRMLIFADSPNMMPEDRASLIPLVESCAQRTITLPSRGMLSGRRTFAGTEYVQLDVVIAAAKAANCSVVEAGK